jgi:hypothetical protein
MRDERDVHRVMESARIILLILGFFCCSINYLKAQDAPELKASLNKSSIVIGERFLYTVETSFPAGLYSLQWVNMPDSIPHFEIIDRGLLDTSVKEMIQHYKEAINFTSFDSGTFTIPSFTLRFKPAGGGNPIDVQTDSFQVAVGYAPLDSITPFHDIKPIIEVKTETPLWVWLAVICGILLLIVIVLLIRKYLRRKKNVEISPVTAYHEAMQSLDKIEQQRLLDNGEIVQFHSQLVEVLKRYVGQTQHINTDSMLSEELMLYLSGKISQDDMTRVASATRMADSVKFAKYIPDTGDSIESLRNTRTVIQHMHEAQKKPHAE